MNILLISFEFPPQPGGIGTYCYQIAKNLNNLDNHITALVHTNSMLKEEIEKFDNQQKFTIIRFKNYKNKVLKILHRIFFSWEILIKNKFDLVFIPYSHAGVIGLMAKAIWNIPYVMMGHGSEFLYKNLFLRFFIKLFFNRADLILTNSNFTADLIQGAGILNKNIKIIPLGADDEMYEKNRYNVNRLKNNYGFENREILLTVGNLSIRKGHKYVIEAVHMLRNIFPDLLYLIIGRGKELENLTEMIEELKLKKHVKIVGFVPYEILPEYYALCDIFILNSSIAPNGDIEGFGIVLVEGGLMGKPVIGTKNCGISEVIDHFKTGLLVEMNNSEETAAAIEQLLKNKKLRTSLGDNFYLKAKNSLTWRAVSQKTDRTIKSFFNKYSEINN